MSYAPLSEEVYAKKRIQRFRTKYRIDSTTGCWVWIGSKNKYGKNHFRGSFSWSRTGKCIDASHASWLIHKGPKPAGLYILHTCDNGLCVNPNHLYAGTQKQNMKDRSDRKRQFIDKEPERAKAILRAVASHPGERNGRAKLTWADVDCIRSSTERQIDLAARFKVTKDLIWRIKANRAWIR